MKFHPIEINKHWQAAARKLKKQGYTYRRRDDSVVPGVFTKGDSAVYLIAHTGRNPHWYPVPADDIPTEFNQSYASQHTGVSKETIKLLVSSGRLPVRRTGKRALIIEDGDLLKWLSSRPRRGNITDTYRKRRTLEISAQRSLESMLRASVRVGDINFNRLFDEMKGVGVEDPEQLMLSDIEAFYGKFGLFDRKKMIGLLEVGNERI